MNGDMERALQMYSLLAAGGPRESLSALVVPGAPPSKSRHRMANGRAYRTEEDKANEAYTGLHVARAIRAPYTGNVALGCVFFRPNRQRIDVDNMLKHVCDAANGIAWVDDSQVTAIMGVAELDAANPRTIIVVGLHQSTLERGTDATYPCSACGAPILRAGQTNMRKTCSKECAARSKGHAVLTDPVICAQCGGPFKRTTAAQTMCSAECRAERLRGQRRASAAPLARCIDCNKELTHRRSPSRCRDCWKAHTSA